MESWGRAHPDEEVRRWAVRAFEYHDIYAMNALRAEFDWQSDPRNKWSAS